MAPDNSRVIVGGSFSTLNGQPANAMGSLDATTGVTLPWAINQVFNNSGSATDFSVTDGTTTKPSVFIRFGTPHEEITKFADEMDVDLVIMGTHGRTGLAHLLVGSVAERVVRTSKVPVLTVPQPDHS